MLHIAISCAGKLDKPYWSQACGEYSKRLGAYCKLTVHQCDDRSPPGWIDKHYAIALCPDGAQMTSPQLADQLAQWQNQSVSRLCFYIGGSDGLPAELVTRCDRTLSLSAMTWPHAVARVLLLEQLYRSFQILAGTAYHK